ncbi:insulinase family protein [Candidatus Woesearchaeota archaeon]|nr:insulinase family protein [Candidatus Woesearchaeota archaeon]
MQLKINRKILKSGLKLFHVQVPSDDVTILYGVNAGSILESKSNAGISHLIEHMLFKGTEKRHSRDSIYNEIRLLGEERFCHTSYTNIPLGMRVVLKDFDHTLNLLSDLLFNSTMDSEEVTKEKQVIMDEMRNRADNPYYYIWEEFIMSSFRETPLEKPIIGFPKSVMNLGQEQVSNFYRKIFTPSNCVLIVVGPQPFTKITQKIEKIVNGYPSKKIIYLPKLNFQLIKTKNRTIKRKLDNVHLMAGQVFPKLNFRESIALDIASSALSRSIFNRLVNEDAISYNGWAYYYNMGSFGILSIYATSRKENISKLKIVIQQELSKFSKGQIDSQYIQDAITSKKKAFILKHPSTMDKAKLLLEFYLQGDIDRINLVSQEYDITLPKTVKKISKKYLNPKNLAYVILGNL